jgi:hypothetical protein
MAILPLAVEYRDGLNGIPIGDLDYQIPSGESPVTKPGDPASVPCRTARSRFSLFSFPHFLLPRIDEELASRPADRSPRQHHKDRTQHCRLYRAAHPNATPGAALGTPRHLLVHRRRCDRDRQQRHRLPSPTGPRAALIPSPPPEKCKRVSRFGYAFDASPRHQQSYTHAQRWPYDPTPCAAPPETAPS